MTTAERKITEILYKNSTDCGQGMVIDFLDIQKVIKLLAEDKVEFAQFHVQKALKEASKKAEVIDGFDIGLISMKASVDEDSIINAYPLTNIK